MKVLEGERAEMGRGLGAIQDRCEEAFREQVSCSLRDIEIR